MTMRGRRLAAATLAVGMILGLAACTGCFDTPFQGATLLVSDVLVTGSQGTVYIAVADMPDGGAASIEFGEVGSSYVAVAASITPKGGTTHPITITHIDETTIVVEGLNGFTGLVWEFTSGGGSLVAANSSTGVVSGQILKITFAVTGANPTFTIDELEVEIGSDLNTLINWILGNEDYYTK